MAKETEIHKLVVESNSKTLVYMGNNCDQDFGATFNLVNRLKNLISGNWWVKVTHTWREGNKCADLLANYGLRLYHNVPLELEHPPTELQHVLINDLTGTLYLEMLDYLSFSLFVSH